MRQDAERAEISVTFDIPKKHDALAWLSQVTMFLLLGLLVFPSRLLEVAPVGLALALFLLALLAFGLTRIGTLRPAFAKDGTITAANASSISPISLYAMPRL